MSLGPVLRFMTKKLWQAEMGRHLFYFNEGEPLEKENLHHRVKIQVDNEDFIKNSKLVAENKDDESADSEERAKGITI